MSGFTPGPWQSHDDMTTEGFITIIGNVDGETHSDGTTTNTFDTICICEDEFGERLTNVAANVRLIRSAPNLVKALQQLERWFNTDPEIIYEMDADTLADHARQLGLIRTALAEAGVK